MVDVPTNSPTCFPVSPPFLSSHNLQSHKKAPASHRAQSKTPIISLALGVNREGKEKVKGEAISRIQRTRIGSALVYALVCVRRNAQHRKLKLCESTRFALIAVVMTVVVSISGPTDCLASPPALSSKSHETAPESYRIQGETQTINFALGANPKGKKIFNGMLAFEVRLHS